MCVDNVLDSKKEYGKVLIVSLRDTTLDNFPILFSNLSFKKVLFT